MTADSDKTACHTASSAMESMKPVLHDDYEIHFTKYVKEYDMFVVLYQHKKTAAQVLSISTPSSETEKVYCAVFRTPVANSKGIPHILEHSVLLGSEKYPVRDIFTDLMKGSMYTFLNAFTYPDRTCYPVASVNTKDFYNLADVYSDVVLRPRAIYDTIGLQQEGWRLELALKPEYAGDQNSDLNWEHYELKYQGVVLNEMKGVYSSPDNLEEEMRRRHLFSGMPEYKYDSGGDPQCIPSLTFEEFVKFFKDMYSPQNAKFFFYGSDNVMARLNFLSSHLDKALNSTDDCNTKIGHQTSASCPFKAEYPYPSENCMEDLITVSWALDCAKNQSQGPPELDAEERMLLSILSHLLVGTPASPLYQALSSSGLGKAVIGGGIDKDLRHITFTTGLKGVKQTDDNTCAVETIILNTLQSLQEKGFEKDAIDAAINTIEFKLREMNTGCFPKGLAFIVQIVADWNYDRHPLLSIEFEEPLNALKLRLSKGENIFQDAIKKYFLDNPHRLTFRLFADETIEAKEKQKEKQILESIMKSKGTEDLLKLKSENEILKEKQMKPDSPEALATLPQLTLNDLDEAPPEIPCSAKTALDTLLLIHDLPTTGILYANVAFSIADLELEDLQYLPLLARMLPECGTSILSSAALMHQIGSVTGGVEIYHDIRTINIPGRIADPNKAVGFFILESKCMKNNIKEMFQLISTILIDTPLNDPERATQILKELANDIEDDIQTAGDRVGVSGIRASFTVAGYANNMFCGLSYLEFLRSLIEKVGKDWTATHQRICSIRDKICRRHNLLLDLTADSPILAQISEQNYAYLEPLLSTIPITETETLVVQRQGKWCETIINRNFSPSDNHGIVLPTQVNYVCYGGRVAEFGEEYSGRDQVICDFLSNGFLWDNVRGLGGAYGVAAQYDSSGVFIFSSYRDPNLMDTINTYNKSASYLEEYVSNSMTDLDLTRAIISIVRKLDKPLPKDRMGRKSMWQHIMKETAEDRKQYREQVLSTSPSDFSTFAKRLDGKLRDATFYSIVVGSEESLKTANATASKPYTIGKVFS